MALAERTRNSVVIIGEMKRFEERSGVRKVSLALGIDTPTLSFCSSDLESIISGKGYRGEIFRQKVRRASYIVKSYVVIGENNEEGCAGTKGR